MMTWGWSCRSGPLWAPTNAPPLLQAYPPALWNLGVFMLRSAPDPTSAYRWEVIIHVGVIALPAFYYHFVLIFLDSTVRRRRWLIVAYGLSALFSLLNLAGSAAFITGVQSTAWGWAPASGPLYHVFFVYFYAFFVAGLIHLGHAGDPGEPSAEEADP